MDIRHDAALAIAVPTAVLVASIATWLICRWWYGRQLAIAALRLEKAEKGRQFSQEQTVQARRQIEQLKSELEAKQKSTGQSPAARRRPEPVEEPHPVAERLPDSGAVLLPLVASHGFADTQILPD